MDIELSIFVLRLLFVGLLYLFLFQVVVALRRDLKLAAAGPAPAELPAGRLAVVESEEPGITTGQVFDLRPNTTIGRGPHNSIALGDTFVSTSHAVVTLRGRRWWIEDLGSTNGTFVNRGQIREAAAVQFGDIIEIGRVKFKLVQ